MGYVVIVMLFITSLAAWGQHVYTCLSEEAWGFLIAGAIFAPIGVFHGIGVWLGYW